MLVAKTEGTVREEILDRLRRRVGPEKSRKYLSGPSRLLRDSGAIHVAVESAFLADLLQRRFGAELAEEARAIAGADVQSRFVADPALRDSRPDAERRLPENVAPAPSPRRTPHPHAGDRSLKRLDDLVVGDCNRLAIDAARRVAQADGAGGLCPLFVHGGCGLGKTHLLQGIAELARRTRAQRVRYTTGEAFTNAFIASLQSRKVDEFRRRFRSVDVLCIDDVHFLSQKSATQEEFLHTFDAIGSSGARVILASDEHPRSIERLQERLVSRFLAGMVVEMTPPDGDMRKRIITALCQRRAVSISPDAAEQLATRVRGSVRDLEGELTRAIAIQRLLDGKPQGDVRVLVPAVDRSLAPSEASLKPRKPVRVEVIMQVVCEALRAPIDEVLGGSRHRRIVLARSLAAHLARRLTTRSYPEIARALNRPNHSTVVTACQRIERRLGAGERLDADIARESGAITLAELVDSLAARACRAAADN